MIIEQTAASITNMIIHGAGKIARAAVTALSDFASNHDSVDKNSFLIDLEKAKKVLLNSMPTVISHGDLVNKMETFKLAFISNEFKVWFYACIETCKFSSMTMLDRKTAIEERHINKIIKRREILDSAKVFNPLFDSILTRYINAVITELGPISSSYAHGLIVKQIENKMFQKVN